MVPLVVFGPRWLRHFLLLAGSLLFYAFWRIDFTVLVVFTAFVDFYAALRIGRAGSARQKKVWLWLSVALNLTVLGFFKYFYFLADTTRGIAGLLGWEFQLDLPFRIILPLGISFYTFHSLSYVFDVYRGRFPVITSFREFLTYVLFWTQLMAGPICARRNFFRSCETGAAPALGNSL
jgi:D-alanyl-lipoteichoic acid acyltransferase DltB (MBOAT superfamily)